MEGLKQDWDETSLEENIEAFETSYLGMVENMAYSDDVFFDAKAFIPQEVENISTQQPLVINVIGISNIDKTNR